MKVMTAISALITTALIAIPALAGGLVVWGGAAIACGALWLLILAGASKRNGLALLLALQTGIAAANIMYGSSIHLAAAGIIFGIIAWDMALHDQETAAFPPAMRRRFAVGHAAQILAISAISMLLVLGSLKLNVKLGYSAALGLSLGAFMLIALLLRLLSPSRRTSRRRRGEAISTLREVLKNKDGRP
ncbi:MAG TPA: hypothetical protein ENL30_02190 [Candidatus Acetothermia bacterium]|nr:hypothetical protein [Candidatus Acetothermia bacterium]